MITLEYRLRRLIAVALAFSTAVFLYHSFDHTFEPFNQMTLDFVPVAFLYGIYELFLWLLFAKR